MEQLKRFKEIHRGQTCVIIGNGPSLNDTELNRLHFPTFGSNQIYRLPFTPTYYSIVDEEMMKACLPLPEEFKPKEMFIRAEAGVGNPIYPIVVRGFSVSIDNFVVIGGTVSYVLLQLAFYMRFHTMLLVGMDHHYPKSSKYGRVRFTAKGNDPDHFKTVDGKPYFEEGKVYNPPELEGVEMYYLIAKDLFQQQGCRVLNLTPGSKLNVFDKDKLENWYG